MGPLVCGTFSKRLPGSLRRTTGLFGVWLSVPMDDFLRRVPKAARFSAGTSPSVTTLLWLVSQAIADPSGASDSALTANGLRQVARTAAFRSGTSQAQASC